MTPFTLALILTTTILTTTAYTLASFTVGRTNDHNLRLVAGVGITLTALAFLAIFDITDPLTIALALFFFAIGAGVRTLREAYDQRRKGYTQAIRQQTQRIKEELSNLG